MKHFIILLILSLSITTGECQSVWDGFMSNVKQKASEVLKKKQQELLDKANKKVNDLIDEKSEKLFNKAENVIISTAKKAAQGVGFQNQNNSLISADSVDDYLKNVFPKFYKIYKLETLDNQNISQVDFVFNKTHTYPCKADPKNKSIMFDLFFFDKSVKDIHEPLSLPESILIQDFYLMIGFLHYGDVDSSFDMQYYGYEFTFNKCIALAKNGDLGPLKSFLSYVFNFEQYDEHLTKNYTLFNRIEVAKKIESEPSFIEALTLFNSNPTSPKPKSDNQQIKTITKSDKLRELKQMLDDKLITEDDYEKQKQKILNEQY